MIRVHVQIHCIDLLLFDFEAAIIAFVKLLFSLHNDQHQIPNTENF